MKNQKRDTRITAKWSWLVEALALFVILLVVNCAQVLIYQAASGLEMRPLPGAVPKSREAFIVNACDKYCASVEGLRI